MVKSEIIEHIFNLNNKLSRKTAQTVVDALFDNIATALIRGGRVEIRGFGVFSIRMRKAGKIRNPRLGTNIESPERRMVHFGPGKNLANRVDVDTEKRFIHKNCG